MLAEVVRLADHRRRSPAARPTHQSRPSLPCLIDVDRVLGELETEREEAAQFARRYRPGTALRAFWSERVGMLDAAWQEIFAERVRAEGRARFRVLEGGRRGH